MDLGRVMAKVTIKDSSEWTKKLDKLNRKTDEIAGKAIYSAAGIVADEIKNNIKKLPVSNKFGTSYDPISGITNKQKADLIDGYGISPMQVDTDFDINVKIGFDGYGSTPTKKYPKGLPNVLLARSIESGTTFRTRTPFVGPGIRKTKKQAISKMDEIIETEIKKLDL